MGSQRFLDSLKYAVEGIEYCIRTQKNMRIHLVFAAAAIAFGVFLGISLVELAIVVIAAVSVLVCEIINTAVEKAVDTAAPEYHPTAKVAKDTAAAAVLVAALNSVVIGVLIFGRYLWAILVKM